MGDYNIILIGATVLGRRCLTIKYKMGTMGDFIKIIVINLMIILK